MKDIQETLRRIEHKGAQMQQAEARADITGTKHDLDSVTANRRVLHALALRLARLTADPENESHEAGNGPVA